MKSIIAMFFAAVSVVSLSAQEEGKVVHYEVKASELKYTYAASYAPVARLKPGNILETNTVDCFGNAVKKPGDTLSLSPGDNPLTGPFYPQATSSACLLASSRRCRSNQPC